MPIYRERPKFVEAIHLRSETAEKVARWTNGQILQLEDGMIAVTFEIGGTLVRVLEGMYVIRDQAGQWNIMTAIDFVGRYELA